MIKFNFSKAHRNLVLQISDFKPQVVKHLSSTGTKKIQNIKMLQNQNGKRYANIDEAVLKYFIAFPQHPKFPVPYTLKTII